MLVSSDGELALLVGDVARLSGRGVEEYSDQPAAFGIDKALLRGVPVSPGRSAARGR